jgi:hypothetical protein
MPRCVYSDLGHTFRSASFINVSNKIRGLLKEESEFCGHVRNGARRNYTAALDQPSSRADPPWIILVSCHPSLGIITIEVLLVSVVGVVSEILLSSWMAHPGRCSR